ncbi:hypothetical protein PFICI_12129 [Pestalotiopsis fici W106-1]|uniref:Glucose-methanol-choline oxidoreductase N-terminal domain-containing protein n=1 Tax=Pestalotiopsis fici (strain W106-1 / CGMCC3.15140) TaxID=1229662 RepID=W3WUF6_PESFW|nr:uncharacterized protein PFICI_12129 [Pestalotiopsis fici W106-1]ETS76742.1 hypothetical protein PFICI_12129 [Pestalotiopsis fici W106-1]
MWPFSSYPEATASEVDGKTYDYVIVGGGTAGCCLAARLSEDPSVSVLVLEKGHVKDNLVSRIPLLSQSFWMGAPLQVQESRFTEPIPNANGRINRMWTAEGLGGASRINAMLLTRGAPGGYNEWADKYGLKDWSWEHVEPYFEKIENAKAHANSDWRGHAGPLNVKQSLPSFKWFDYIGTAAEALGLPIENDYNDPSAPAMGLFRLDMTIDDQGKRVSAYSAFLNKQTATQRQNHLTVCTGVVASHLDIDQTGTVRRVYFCPVETKRNQPRDKTESMPYVNVRREVIICSGAVCSPLVLMRSGIGPQDQLEAQGIPITKELPVGTRLQDHWSFAIMLELPKYETLSGLLESIYGLWHMILWIVLGVGLFSRSSTPLSIFVRTTAIDDQTMTINSDPENMDMLQARNIPDTEIMIQAVNSFERAIEGRSLMSFFPTMVQPYSTGRLELVSKDPLANPRIIHPMLRDSRDLQPIRRAVRFTMRLAEEFGEKSGYPYPAPLAFAPGVNMNVLSDWEMNVPNTLPKEYALGRGQAIASIKSPAPKSPPPKTPPRTWRTVTDDEIDDYVRRVGMSSLHVASTCPMSNDDKTGVVDQKLRVHGIKNLRVADASVFPRVPSAHTMAPTIMVAERCADFIKDWWKDSNVE